MVSISAPDTKQSEAYAATTALFYVFGSSTKEDKVFLRLPATWRDLWTEYADLKKERADEADRASIRQFRAMVREKRDRELEDGVLIEGAFRGRAAGRVPENSNEPVPDKLPRPNLDPQFYQRIWADKSSSPSYKHMLVSSMVCGAKLSLLMTKIEITDTAPNVGFQRRGPPDHGPSASDHYLWRDWMVSYNNNDSSIRDFINFYSVVRVLRYPRISWSTNSHKASHARFIVRSLAVYQRFHWLAV